MGGWRALHQIFGRGGGGGGSSTRWKIGPNGIWGFVKMRGQKDLRTVKKRGVNKIENQGENWYKMFQNGQITNYSEK